MLGALKAYHDGYVKAPPVDSPVERLANYMTVNVSRKMRDLTVKQLTTLNGILHELGRDMANIRQSPKLAFPADKAWGAMFETTQLQLTLWGSQRVDYVGAYNAYECF